MTDTGKQPATVGFVRVPANTKYTKSNGVIPEYFCPPLNFVSRNCLGMLKYKYEFIKTFGPIVLLSACTEQMENTFDPAE
jgi:hypothetical protein